MVWTIGDTKYLLSESYSTFEALKKLHPIRDYYEILQNKDAWETYVDSLSQGLSESDAAIFRSLAKNIRMYQLAESYFGAASSAPILAYERLALPILRVFWPTLVAKHLVTVETMDGPEIVRYFLKPKAKLHDGTVVDLPYWQNQQGQLDASLTKGPKIDVNQVISLNNNTATVNLKQLAGLNPQDDVIIERNFAIVAVGHTKDNDNVVWNETVRIVPDVNGRIAQKVTITDSDGTVYVDTITGYIDYVTGDLIVNSSTGNVDKIKVTGNISLITNYNLPQVFIETEKLYIKAEEFGINVQYPIEYIQDFSRLFDLDLQAEFVQLMAAQIANDIDTRILIDLYNLAKTYGAQDTFSRTRPNNFYGGDLEWQRQIVTKINTIRARIRQVTRINAPVVLAMSPEDVALLESFHYYQVINNGELVGTDITITGSTVQLGKLQNGIMVVSSEKIPRGEVLFVMKSNLPQAAVYIFAEYIPLYFQPYPLGNVPSLTLKYRAGFYSVRKEGTGYLRITD